MRPSVRHVWHQFSEPLEGRVHSMYVDVKGLVTTGVGNLIDPVSLALQLPWKLDLGGGRLATQAEVSSAWQDIKNNRETLKRLHWKYAAERNKLRLTDADIDKLVEEKLLQFEDYLKRKHFPDWDSFPADGQLGILSMSWACGPGFPQTFKNFRAAVLAQDWEAARASCKIREEGNPGVVPRNRHNRTCFSNAAIVVQSGLDRETLHWPGTPTVSDEPPPQVPDATEERPLMPALGQQEDSWIGDSELGLPDDVLAEIAEQKRLDILENK